MTALRKCARRNVRPKMLFFFVCRFFFDGRMMLDIFIFFHEIWNCSVLFLHCTVHMVFLIRLNPHFFIMIIEANLC